MNVMNVAIGQLNYRCNLKSVNIRWSKFSSKLVKLTNSSRSGKSSKLLELLVFVFIFIFLSDDNGARSASFSSSEFFLVFKFYMKWAFFVLIMTGSFKILRNKNPDLDFPNETYLNFRENPLHRDLAGI